MAETKAIKKPGTKLFSRINYQFQRGIRGLLSDKDLSREEWELIKSIFDNHCSFCGKPDTNNTRTGLIPDHLIPTTENGEFCIGNIVPTCHDCNDRRGSKNWKEYLISNFSKESNERISKIEEYLKKYNYHPIVHLGDLTEKEETEYKNIVKEWEILWNRLRNLRDNIKNRRSNNK